jgi:group II intron reverse transcriptase/maturase
MSAPSYAYITDLNNLSKACQKVLRKGSVGGIDQVSVTAFAERAEAELALLQAELIARQYIPEPYMEVKVPKKDNEKRSLGLMTVRDKIVQQVVNDALVPYFEPIFLPSSYAYRPQRGVPQAVRRVWDGIERFDNRWVVRCDIDRFFDNIPHTLLEIQIRVYLKDDDLVQLIMLCMGMGKVSKSGAKWQPSSGKGVAQGGILSPLLANIYLHQLDGFIRNLRKPIGYVRYADDFVVLAREKNLADSVGNQLTQFLTDKLGLVLDEKEIKPIKKGFLFLGIWFTDTGYGLSADKQKELCAKIEDTLTLDKTGINPKFFETVEGIRRYHGQLLAPEVLQIFDEKIVSTIHQQLQAVPLEISQKQKRLWIEKLDFLTPAYRQAKQRMAIALCKPNAPVFTLENNPKNQPITEGVLPNIKVGVTPSPLTKTTAADAPPFVTDTKPSTERVKKPAKTSKMAQKTPPKPEKPEKAKLTEPTQEAVPTPDAVNEPFEINPKKMIAQKRREYEKREGASLELVISQPGIQLGIMNRRITVKHQGQNLLKNPTANVRHISIMARWVSFRIIPLMLILK